MVAGARRRSNAHTGAGQDVRGAMMTRRQLDLSAILPNPMPIDLTTVAIVLDDNFGAALQPLAERMPVWIVDSPGNRAAIEGEWTRRRRDGVERELSVFRMIDGLSPADHLVALLRTIDSAHGPAAQEPPFTTLLVFGAAPDDALTGAIGSAGGSAPQAMPDGFSAKFARRT